MKFLLDCLLTVAKWFLLVFGALALFEQCQAAECRYPDGHFEWPEGPTCPAGSVAATFPHVFVDDQPPGAEYLLEPKWPGRHYGHGYYGHSKGYGKGYGARGYGRGYHPSHSGHFRPSAGRHGGRSGRR
jgi:hypothetical protein